MCEAKPGLRCAADTRHVAEATSRAYHDVFGTDAPPVGPGGAAMAGVVRQPQRRPTMAEARDLDRAVRTNDVRTWSDPPAPGRSEDDWPYPDAYAEYTPPDSLRDAVRNRTGNPTGRVTLVGQTVSGGWSEYTQANDYAVAVLVDGREVFRTDLAHQSDAAMMQLLNWLDAPTR